MDLRLFHSKVKRNVFWTKPFICIFILDLCIGLSVFNILQLSPLCKTINHLIFSHSDCALETVHRPSSRSASLIGSNTRIKSFLIHKIGYDKNYKLSSVSRSMSGRQEGVWFQQRDWALWSLLLRRCVVIFHVWSLFNFTSKSVFPYNCVEVKYRWHKWNTELKKVWSCESQPTFFVCFNILRIVLRFPPWNSDRYTEVWLLGCGTEISILSRMPR